MAPHTEACKDAMTLLETLVASNGVTEGAYVELSNAVKKIHDARFEYAIDDPIVQLDVLYSPTKGEASLTYMRVHLSSLTENQRVCVEKLLAFAGEWRTVRIQTVENRERLTDECSKWEEDLCDLFDLEVEKDKMVPDVWNYGDAILFDQVTVGQFLYRFTDVLAFLEQSSVVRRLPRLEDGDMQETSVDDALCDALDELGVDYDGDSLEDWKRYYGTFVEWGELVRTLSDLPEQLDEKPAHLIVDDFMEPDLVHPPVLTVLIDRT